MRNWKYIGEWAPTNEVIYYIRLAENEYYPIMLTYYESNMAFGIDISGPLIPIKWVLKFTPAFPE